MKKYMLFDLDGTLTDPKIGITTCVQYALRSFGIEEPDLDKLEPFIGPPLKESFMQFYGMDDEQAEEAVKKYRERFQDIGIFENKIYDGIPAMLRTLKSKGMHLAVASSKPTVFVERILEYFHINQYFEVVVGSELDGTRVNKDEVVWEALNRLFHYKPIQRELVYMIGDRKFDVEGARLHRIESVGVAYGYGSMQELKEAKADYIVRSVEELQKFLLRGTEDEGKGTEGKKADPTQRLWALAMPFLMFMVVRGLAMNILITLVRALGASLPESVRNLVFVKYQADAIEFTGSAATVMVAISFIAGAVSVWPRAKRLIAKTADDMKLAHLKREPGLSYVLLAVAVVGAVIGFNLLFALSGAMGQSAAYQEVATKQYAGAIVLGLVCNGLVTPFAEELLFRGILYNLLRRFNGIKMAIPISAMLFGMYHMNAIQGMYGFLMGCLLAYGYEYFGSYKVPVTIHIVANLLAYSLTYTNILSAGAVSWVLCIVSLAAMAVSVLGLHRRKNIF